MVFVNGNRFKVRDLKSLHVAIKDADVNSIRIEEDISTMPNVLSLHLAPTLKGELINTIQPNRQGLVFSYVIPNNCLTEPISNNWHFNYPHNYHEMVENAEKVVTGLGLDLVEVRIRYNGLNGNYRIIYVGGPKAWDRNKLSERYGHLGQNYTKALSLITLQDFESLHG